MYHESLTKNGFVTLQIYIKTPICPHYCLMLPGCRVAGLPSFQVARLPGCRVDGLLVDQKYQAFQVVAFGMKHIDRMIGWLRQLVKDPGFSSSQYGGRHYR